MIQIRYALQTGGGFFYRGTKFRDGAVVPDTVEDLQTATQCESYHAALALKDALGRYSTAFTIMVVIVETKVAPA